LGIAADSGIAQCPVSPEGVSFVSLIRAKELAPAAIAEASERLAIAKARKSAEEAEAHAQGQVLGGSSAAPLADGTTAAECPASAADAPGVGVMPAVSKKMKKRVLTSSLPPRENLRMTPARQARAAERVSQ
jgi:hypothetical protein